MLFGGFSRPKGGSIERVKMWKLDGITILDSMRIHKEDNRQGGRMATSGSQQTTDPTLRATLREDFRQQGFWQKLRREFVELKEFSIDEGRRTTLAAMGPIKRGFYIGWWILKQMILKLTPVRRILVVAGIVFLLISDSIKSDQVTVQPFLGAALLLFVLLLELKDRLLATDELEAGRTVQRSLMPDQNPQVPGWSLWLFSRSANEVGGDLVDFLPLGPSKYAVALADVSGKGLKAALLTAKLQTIIRTLAPDFDSMSLLVGKVNEVFRRDGLPNVFASMLYIQLTPDSPHLRFINAGHLPPLLLRGNGVYETPKGDPALGLLHTVTYAEQTAEFDHGDVLFGYSDGLTEARNERGDFFGIERLLALLPSLRTLSAPGIGARLTEEVDRFAGDAHRHDDLTLLVLKRL